METVPSKDDLLHLDLYVKWPQLENALLNYPSRPGSRGSGRRINESCGSFATSPGSPGDVQNDSRPSSRSDSRPNGSVPGRRRLSFKLDFFFSTLNQIPFDSLRSSHQRCSAKKVLLEI